MKKKEQRDFRGKEVAMIFQDPMTSLNPVLTIGDQLGEAITTHFSDVKKDVVRERVTELLRLVGVPNPETRFDQYPHEFSGGMRQRAMIAMSIANSPSLLIADEPTTALDVTIQAQVLEVMKRVQAETHAATILITHDLGIVAEMCDRVLVMYAGHIVESGDVDDDLPGAAAPVHDRPHEQPAEAHRGRGVARADSGRAAVAHRLFRPAARSIRGASSRTGVSVAGPSCRPSPTSRARPTKRPVTSRRSSSATSPSTPRSCRRERPGDGAAATGRDRSGGRRRGRPQAHRSRRGDLAGRGSRQVLPDSRWSLQADRRARSTQWTAST